MQNDKDHLNLDLTFLDEKGPRSGEKRSDTSYKINWKNIAVIGGIVVAIGAIIFLNNNSPIPTTATPSVGVPGYQSPASSGAGTVNVGQFRCSNSDARRADQLSPVDSSAIATEQRALDGREEALTRLQAEINSSGVSQYSPQAAIDRYNAMIEQYNFQLTSYN